jgi:hypothetical protein
VDAASGDRSDDRICRDVGRAWRVGRATRSPEPRFRFLIVRRVRSVRAVRISLRRSDRGGVAAVARIAAGGPHNVKMLVSVAPAGRPFGRARCINGGEVASGVEVLTSPTPVIVLVTWQGFDQVLLGSDWVSLAHMASAPRRVLIDWDWGADGIWTIGSPAELAAPAPTGGWFSYGRPVSAQALRHPWSDKLSAGLLDALKQWNDQGGRLFHYLEPELDEQDGEKQIAAFYSRGAELAGWTQRELGPDYEVLFVTADDAWQWADPPGSREPPLR